MSLQDHPPMLFNDLFALYADRHSKEAETKVAAGDPQQRVKACVVPGTQPGMPHGTKRKAPTEALPTEEEAASTAVAHDSKETHSSSRGGGGSEERPAKRRRIERQPPFVSESSEDKVCDVLARVIGDSTLSSMDHQLARFGTRMYSLHGSYFTVHLAGDVPIEVAALEACLAGRSFPRLAVTDVDLRGQDRCVRIELALPTRALEFHNVLRVPAAYVERKVAASATRTGRALYPHADASALAAMVKSVDAITTKRRVLRDTEQSIARLRDDQYNADMLLPIAEFVAFSRKDATPSDLHFAAEYDTKCMQFCLRFTNVGNFKLHELLALRASLPRHIASVDFCPVSAQLTVMCCEYVHPMPTEYNRVVVQKPQAQTQEL